MRRLLLAPATALVLVLVAAPARAADPTLRSVPVDGSAPPRVIGVDRDSSSGIFSLRWSDDGTSVLAVAGRFEEAGGTYGVHRYAADGTTRPGRRVRALSDRGFEAILGPAAATMAELTDRGLRYGRGGVEFRDTATGRVLARLPQAAEGDELYEAPPTVVFSRDGRIAAVEATERVGTRHPLRETLRFVDLHTGRVLRRVAGASGNGAFSPRGDRFASVTGLGPPEVIDVASGRRTRLREWRPEASAGSVLWSPVDDRLLLGHGDAFTFTTAAGAWGLGIAAERSTYGRAAWSPDGTTIAWAQGVGEDDAGSVHVASADLRTPPRALVDGIDGFVVDVAFSPDGTRLAYSIYPD